MSTKGPLFQKIHDEIVKAMKAKAQTRLDALKMVKAELMHNEKEASPKPELDVIMSYRKKLAKSLELYQSKPDAQDALKRELAIVDEFIPKAPTQEEIEILVNKHIHLKNFGQVMKAVREDLSGPFDGKMIGDIIKSKLG